MAIKALPLGIQKTTSTGAALTLIAPVAGNQALSSVMSATDTCIYYLKDANGTGWEFGIGTLTSISPDVFTRAATPLSSSNAGASITLSVGTHTIKNVDYPANLIPGAGGIIDCHGAFLTNVTLATAPIIRGDTLLGRLITNSALHNAVSGNTHSIRPYNGNHYSILMDADKILTIQNDDGESRGSMTFTLVLTQDAIGGRSITLPATWQGHGDYPVEIPTTPDSITVIRVVSTGNESSGADTGNNWRYWVEPGYYTPPTPLLSEEVNGAWIGADQKNTIYLHPSYDPAPATWTVLTDPLYPIGSSTRLMGQSGSGVVTLVMTAPDTLTLAPSGATGSRILTAPFDATVTKITATDWIISGVGIS